jgi:hypothetical protein
LAGLTNPGGVVHVTTYISNLSSGNIVPARCNATDWHADTTGTTVHVACVDKNGAPINNVFMLSYSYGATMGLYSIGGTNLGAYTVGTQPTQTKRYHPGDHFQYNSFGTGPLPIQRTGTGLYTVSVPGTLSYSTSTVLVDAIGPAGVYCNLADWSGAATFHVACFAQGGVPTDSKFGLTFQSSP